MVKTLDNKHFFYMVFIALLFNSVPVLEYCLWKQEHMLHTNIIPSWLISRIVLIPCIGYFLDKKINIERVGNKLPWIWLVNIILIALSTFATTLIQRDNGILIEDIWGSFYENFSFFNCIAVFLSIKVIVCNSHISERKQLSKLILSFGKSTFGIYLLHPLVMKIPISQSIMWTLRNSWMPQMVSVWIYVCYVFFVSYCLTELLRKIPGIRKLIGG